MTDIPCGHKKGPSSFWMQDPSTVFQVLNLREGNTLLDLGCSVGDYSIEALKYIGSKGKVYSIDVNTHSINLLKQRIHKKQIVNIHPLVKDISQTLSILEDSVDHCLISTVLHCIPMDIIEQKILKEVRRVLKPKGSLVIIECHKDKLEFGPPESMRISPEQLEDLLIPLGYKKSNYKDLGFNYLMQFRLE